MTIPKPVNEEPRSTKDRILDASIDLFSRTGFNGVSIRDIARVVGIKESSIYNHFKSKEEILDTIFDQFQREMERTVPTDEDLDRALQALSPEQFWRGGLSRFVNRTQTTRMENISKIVLYEMFRSERARDLAIMELFTRQQNVVKKILNAMLDRGTIAETDVDALATAYAYTMLSLQLEITLRKSWGLDTKPVEDRMLRHIKFISNLVSAR